MKHARTRAAAAAGAVALAVAVAGLGAGAGSALPNENAVVYWSGIAEQAISAQDEDPEGAALLKSQAARRRKHLPIRQLFSAAPEVTLSLKPCWAMSPLVVASTLPPGRWFDVVMTKK